MTFSLHDFKANPEQAQLYFKKHGFLFLTNVFSSKVCSNAVSAINKLEASLAPSNTVSVVTEDINSTTLVKYFQGIYSESSSFKPFFCFDLLNISRLLIGQDDLYFADLEAHIRNPGGGEIPKHQDNFYFNLSNAKGLTFYIALTKHDKNSGGLNYLHQSHDHVLNHNSSSCPGFSSYIEDSTNQSMLTSRTVFSPSYSIGDISIHHPNNIHWSDPAPFSSVRGYALSARVFCESETINEMGRQRYLQLLQKNRSL